MNTVNLKPSFLASLFQTYSQLEMRNSSSLIVLNGDELLLFNTDESNPESRKVTTSNMPVIDFLKNCEDKRISSKLESLCREKTNPEAVFQVEKDNRHRITPFAYVVAEAKVFMFIRMGHNLISASLTKEEMRRNLCKETRKFLENEKINAF